MNSSSDLLKSLKIDRSAPAHASRKGLRITLAVLAVIALLTIGAWLWLSRDQGVEVSTATVEAIPVAGAGGHAPGTSVLDASGYVVARRMATVSAKITGRVREILIEEGQRVEPNQVVAILDPVDADAQRALNASQLSAARSRAGSVEARLKQAETNTERLSRLVGGQLVSRAEFDQAVAERDALRAEALTAQRDVTVAADSLRIADIGVNNTVVRAPFAGVVTTKDAQPGEIVSPLSAGGGFTRTGIGTIVDMDSLEIEVEVGEAYIGRVKPRMPVEATLNAYPDWKIPAEVIAIIPTADRGKATVTVRVALKRKDARIVPEMGANVSFLDAERPAQDGAPQRQSMRVPANAIAQRDGGDVAFVLAGADHDQVEQRALKLGRALGDGREVLSGVSAGETVVLDPPPELADAGKVRVAQADGAD